MGNYIFLSRFWYQKKGWYDIVWDQKECLKLRESHRSQMEDGWKGGILFSKFLLWKFQKLRKFKGILEWSPRNLQSILQKWNISPCLCHLSMHIRVCACLGMRVRIWSARCSKMPACAEETFKIYSGSQSQRKELDPRFLGSQTLHFPLYKTSHY